MKDESESRGTCPECGYRVSVAVPRNGDGSARICRTHYLYCGQERRRCEGSRMVCVEDDAVFKRVRGLV